jgi:Transcription antiterminator
MTYRIPPSQDDADGRLPVEAPRWFVVAAVAGREKTALAGVQETIKARGLRAYLPCERRWMRINGRRIKIERALLAGYLFAELTADLFPAIRPPDRGEGIEGVRGLMTCTTATGRVPAAVHPAFVEQLAFCEAMGAFDHTRPSGRLFSPEEGARVMVNGGQFQGLIGRIARAKPGARRVKVALEGCGIFGSGALELDVGLLRAA